MAKKQQKQEPAPKPEPAGESWVPMRGAPLISAVAPSTPTRVRVRKVIEVEAVRGCGIQDDPARTVYQYYDFKGRLLAERPLAWWDRKRPQQRSQCRFNPDQVDTNDILPPPVHGTMSITKD